MERYITCYNNLLIHVKENTMMKNFDHYMNLSNDSKYQCILNFYNSLNNDDLFKIFNKMKVKVFSSTTVETHAVSVSLFDANLTLKYIFNSMNENDLPDNEIVEIKNECWEILFRLYIEMSNHRINKAGLGEDIDNNMKVQTQTRISTLINTIKNIKNTSNAPNNILVDSVTNNLFNVNVNNNTNNMLNDIVGSFTNSITNKSNPFDNIMNITNMISDKYQNQLENGNIELDKIIGSIDGLLPGLMKNFTKPVEEPTVIIDENFCTKNVTLGKDENESASPNNIASMMKMIPNISGLMNMATRINTAETEGDISLLKNEMDTFLEKEFKVDITQFNNILNNVEKKFEHSSHEDVD